MGIRRELGHQSADLAKQEEQSSSVYPAIFDDDDRVMLEVALKAQHHFGTSDVEPCVDSEFDGSNVHVVPAFQFQQ